MRWGQGASATFWDIAWFVMVASSLFLIVAIFTQVCLAVGVAPLGGMLIENPLAGPLLIAATLASAGMALRLCGRFLTRMVWGPTEVLRHGMSELSTTFTNFVDEMREDRRHDRQDRQNVWEAHHDLSQRVTNMESRRRGGRG